MASENKSVLFPTVLAALALLAWTAAAFLGFIYSGVGLFLSVLFALLLLLVMGSALYLLVWSNRNIDMDNRKRTAIHRIALLFFFAGALVGAFYLNHFLRVSLDRKEAVQAEALAQINELEATFSPDPAVPYSFAGYLDKRMTNMEREMVGNNIAEGDRKLRILNWKQKMYSTLVDPDDANSSYELTQQEVNDALSGFRSTVEAWDPFSIVTSLEDLTAKKKKWESYAELFQQADPDSEKEPYVLKSDHNQDLGGIIGHPGFSTIWQSVAAIVVLLLLMLLPSILTRKPKGDSRRARDIRTIPNK